MDGILDGGLEVWDGYNIRWRICGLGWMEYWMEDWMDGILGGRFEVWDGWNIGWRIGGVGWIEYWMEL